MTRKELLAVVTFIKHFRPYLLGKQFTLRTDHSSLTWLFRTRDPEGQLARWLERLQEYDFTIEHRAGPKHVNADAMSRLPCTQCGRSSHDEDADSFPGLYSGRGSHEDADSLPGSVSVSACTRHKTEPLPEMSQEDWRKVQLQDPTVGFVLRAMEKGEKPRYNLLKTKSLEARLLVRKLEVIDGVLWRRFEDDRGRGSYTQLVVPRALRDGVLGELHAGVVGGHLGEAGGHLGEAKVLDQLRRRFYWPGYSRSVRDWCRTCGTCATRKSGVPKNRAPLQTIQAGYPMQIIAADIMGPLPESEAGNSYILVVGDYFTRWMEAFPIPNQEAVTVARSWWMRCTADSQYRSSYIRIKGSSLSLA